MDAKELLRLMAAGRIALVDPTTSHPHLTQEIVHRALSLLAAAEANDGTTPETDAAEIKVQLGSDYALTGTVHYTTCARLERERNAALQALDRERKANAPLTIPSFLRKGTD